jgi:hypothetical protein
MLITTHNQRRFGGFMFDLEKLKLGSSSSITTVTESLGLNNSPSKRSLQQILLKTVLSC